MALESEPKSTLIGGSNLDDLKSESANNVDLEDGEIDDDEDEVGPLVPNSTSTPPSKPTFSPSMQHTSKGPDSSRRDSPPWPQHRTSHNAPTAHKNKKGLKRNWEPPHKKPFHNDEEDVDDFAVHLEKALREKAQKHQAMKEGTTGDGAADGSDTDDHGRKNKKRKSRWDDDDERETKQSKRSRDGDDDDMIFVRGASPHHNESRDLPSFGGDFKNSFDSYPEDEDDYDEMNDRNSFSFGRGRGRGSKVLRGRGRGRSSTSSEMLRGGFSKRGVKRGNLRGGSLSKPHMIRDRIPDNICLYYMQGKCAKGSDDCPYSHDAQPPRKMELCKFYMKNCCAKKEKCLYMHKDFPCKLFHTGRRCDSGEHCRFSHGKLSDITRNVLLKHLELAPKEILGEFKRFTREQANQIIDKAAKLRAQGKNPEGLNLLTCDDEGGYNSGDERSNTPMPSSPGEPVPHETDFKRSRDEGSHISRKRDSRDKYRDHDKNRSRESQHESFDRKEHGEKKEHRERKRKRRWDSPDSSPSQLEKQLKQLKKELLLHEGSDKSLLNTSVDSTATNKSLEEEPKNSPFGERNAHNNKFVMSPSRIEGEEQSDRLADKHTNVDKLYDMKKEEVASASDKPHGHENSGESEGESQDSSGAIPSHLPKRQRELFMRIHQQMREADQSNDKKPSESSDDPPPEDDWYSSDEDGPTSLTDLIKSLPKGQKPDDKSNKQSESIKSPENKQSDVASRTENQVSNLKAEPTSLNLVQQPRRPPLLPTPINLNDLMKSSAIDQLLSSIRYGSQAKHSPDAQTQQESISKPAGLLSPSQSLPAEAPAPTPVPVRDPRLSRDPRSRGGSNVVVPSPLGSPSSSHPSETRADPRLERGEARVDPRLDRRDPRTDPRIEHRSDAPVSPRAEAQPRPVDPRSARMESRRTSEGSSSSTGSSSNVSQIPPKSIYDGTGLPLAPGSGDIDLRIGPNPFQLPASQLGSGDMDMRRSDYPLAAAHPLPAHDTDLRFGLNNPMMDIDADYAASSHNDLDLRRLEMMLPFKPAPLHSAATEINASLSSYTPGPYSVAIVDIPRPDFSSLKINPEDPQAKLDPRLRRLFRLSQDEPLSDTAPEAEAEAQPEFGPSSSSSEPVSLQVAATPVVVPSDPRRRSSTSAGASRPADPRQSRSIAGTSGFCPPTPRMDDFDDNADQQSYYGQQWEGASRGRGRGLLPTPDRSEQPAWGAPNWSRPPYQRPYHQQRSYTPPPS